MAAFAPFVLAYLTFYFWAPEGRMNYGELIEPARPLPDAPLTLADGQPFRLGALRGKWVLLLAAPGACDDRGKDRDRRGHAQSPRARDGGE